MTKVKIFLMLSGYQLTWFMCVFGEVIYNSFLPGLVCGLVFLIICFFKTLNKKKFIITVLSISIIGYILDSILVTLHPFMPFITEDIWQNIKKRENPIIIESWERELNNNSNLSEADEVITLINVVSNIRSIKAELNIKAKELLFLEIKEGDKLLSIKNLDFYLNNLVKVSINKVNKLSEKAAVFNIENSELALIIPDNIDLTSELDRVIKEEEKIKKEISNLSKRLENKAFINKAPKEVVEENVKKLDELKLENESIKSSKELIKNLISK